MSVWPVDTSNVQAIERNLGGMMNAHERNVLIAIARSVSPRRVLEIGVNEGRGARMLLDHVPSIREYVGVDVMPGYEFGIKSQEPELPRFPGIMCRADARFTLEVTPRGLYDFKPGALGMFDMIIIDGDHTEAAVHHDTMWADACIYRAANSHNGGLIVWHDAFAWSEDINMYLTARSATRTIYHATDTMLAWERT